jgi:hypothetical protein
MHTPFEEEPIEADGEMQSRQLNCAPNIGKRKIHIASRASGSTYQPKPIYSPVNRKQHCRPTQAKIAPNAETEKVRSILNNAMRQLRVNSHPSAAATDAQQPMNDLPFDEISSDIDDPIDVSTTMSNKGHSGDDTLRCNNKSEDVRPLAATASTLTAAPEDETTNGGA